MAKGSGTTRASGSRNPQGISNQVNASGGGISTALRMAEKSPFTVNEFKDEWTLNTPLGKAEIIKAYDDYGDKYYDVLLYEEDGKLNTSYESGEIASLNEAKRTAREALWYMIDRKR